MHIFFSYFLPILLDPLYNEGSGYEIIRCICFQNTEYTTYKFLLNFLGFLLMSHVLLHWLQLHSNRKSSSLFLALLLFSHSFGLLSCSLRIIAFSFVQLSMKSQKQHFSRERLILMGRKFQKVWELVFLSPKSIRVLSSTSRRMDSKMNAFKNPPTKSSSFFLSCLLYFSPPS